MLGAFGEKPRLRSAFEGFQGGEPVIGMEDLAWDRHRFCPEKKSSELVFLAWRCQFERVKLERLLKGWGQWGRREVREKLSQGLVRIDGNVVTDAAIQVGSFDKVECDGCVVQNRKVRNLMLHKPLGVVSATIDQEHQTVIELIKEDWAQELHLAGRLDRFTSGLMVLTNDSNLSEALTTPERKQGKRYRVSCDQAIHSEIVSAFEKGMWFAKEEITTQPAQVNLLSETECFLTIYEGKHHQVKRMFAQFDVKVVALHREAMGSIELDSALLPGQWRELRKDEVQGVLNC